MRASIEPDPRRDLQLMLAVIFDSSTLSRTIRSSICIEIGSLFPIDDEQEHYLRAACERVIVRAAGE